MMPGLVIGEHEDEAQPGLPQALPAGERVLWQGAPDARLLARHALHWRALASYFALLLALHLANLAADGAPATQWLGALALSGALAALVLGLVAGFAGLVHRTALYTLTNRRLVLRIGVVLTVTYNLPLKRVESVALRRLAGGGGDIAIRLLPADRIGWLHLWPHARPWHLARPEPMLRALPEADPVATLLQQALAQSLAEEQPASLGADLPAATPLAAADTLSPAAGRSGQTHLRHAA